MFSSSNLITSFCLLINSSFKVLYSLESLNASTALIASISFCFSKFFFNVSISC
ncbi:hypothetical protein J6P11_06210 [bacterium]|nr:hypothetical protein [bacterium]